jgi:hypothetical protein
MSRVIGKSSGGRRAGARAVRAAIACAALSGAWAAPAASAHSISLAHIAGTVRTTDTAHLNYNEERSQGSWLYEEGSAGGTLPGSMRANCNITATFKAVFTIYVHGGSISGRAAAAVHGSGLYQSFGGSLWATGGTGRYAHAHGRGGFYGVLNRNTYNMTIQTTGTLSY